MKMLHRLYADESGFVISAELILIASIVVLGLIVGMTAIRDAVTTEMADTASSFGQVNQSFSISGAMGHASSTAGSFFTDQSAFSSGPLSNNTNNGINITPPTPEQGS
jgi:Flp pilus assembly pilin Flp